MIKEVKMFTIVCDCCGEDAFADSDYSCYNDEETAEEIAKDDHDWIEEKDKHYCPDCYSYDDQDKLIIKTKDQ